MTGSGLHFPLFERAERLGVLDGESALIVAPTATGKSHIGREAICRALERGRSGTHAYLVPYRALATEVFESFLDRLGGTDARIRILTGDHRDPLAPTSADLVVATYESFVGLLRREGFRPGVIVADEVHLIADEARGPLVEGLFARLLASRRVDSLCALSAVVDNADELAGWLGVPLLAGTAADRPVSLTLEHALVDDLDEGLEDVIAPCANGEQALVFCSSRAGAEKAARRLAPIIESYLPENDREHLARLADEIRDNDEGAEDVVELLPCGVAYHHAGLPKSIRMQIEAAFRARKIRVVTGTTTLAAGVNLPAGIAVVRDVFRSDVVRGDYRRVLLPSGEILNMLGRAARPHQVQGGKGIALVEKRFRNEEAVKLLLAAIEAGRGGVVSSRLAESFEGLMRFVLAVIAERGEATREDVAAAFSKTLAYRANPEPIRFDRAFEDDMMEDLPSYDKVVKARGTIYLDEYSIAPEGVHATIASGEKRYDVVIGILGVSCTCPAASQFYRGRICKHEACAIHDLLFEAEIDPEARYRTIYNCGHVFGATLDVGTKLGLALEILTAWGLVERVAAGWRVTKVGNVAAGSRFDLLFVHETIQRIQTARSARFDEVALWAVEDFFAKKTDREKWLRAIDQWIAEVDEHEMPLPTRYRGDFESRLDELAGLCLLYEQAAVALGKHEVAQAAHAAAGAVRYGVRPELVPLMALRLPQLARARSRYLYEKGVRNLRDLVNADAARLADPRRAPARLVAQWIEQAKKIRDARAVSSADLEKSDAEFDEIIIRFRIDPDALA